MKYLPVIKGDPGDSTIKVFSSSLGCAEDLKVVIDKLWLYMNRGCDLAMILVTDLTDATSRLPWYQFLKVIGAPQDGKFHLDPAAFQTASTLKDSTPQEVLEKEVTEPAAAPEIYISYHLEESSDKADILCDAGTSRELRFKRDKGQIKIGESIRNYMQELSRGERIALFLGPGYLESTYCCWELHHIWRHCESTNTSISRRVVPFIDPSLNLSIHEMVAERHSYWIEKLRKVNEQRICCVQNNLPTGIWEDEWKWIRAFCDEFPDMLAFLNDRLIPKNFDEMARDNFDSLWDLFEI